MPFASARLMAVAAAELASVLRPASASDEGEPAEREDPPKPVLGSR